MLIGIRTKIYLVVVKEEYRNYLSRRIEIYTIARHFYFLWYSIDSIRLRFEMEDTQAFEVEESEETLSFLSWLQDLVIFELHPGKD